MLSRTVHYLGLIKFLTVPQSINNADLLSYVMFVWSNSNKQAHARRILTYKCFPNVRIPVFEKKNVESIACYQNKRWNFHSVWNTTGLVTTALGNFLNNVNGKVYCSLTSSIASMFLLNSRFDKKLIIRKAKRYSKL